MKIISGGQTGIDRMALELAKELGIKTGGIAPKGYLTENGPDLTLRDNFGLLENINKSYPARTRLNILLSHGTIVFGDLNSPGSKLVINYCKENFHPILLNPNEDEIINFHNSLIWRSEDGSVCLNIAGNRGSKISKEDLDRYREILKHGLIKSGKRIYV